VSKPPSTVETVYSKEGELRVTRTGDREGTGDGADWLSVDAKGGDAILRRS
jgi:hypothetical protein